ncbi:MAG: Uma2 family endonuclease [Oscillatoriales cyanobacterium RU_3_3]|nr:Uma2 family endonuclease [Oscillatoriales cyanobacterium RU_3_3]NJR23082.1 Uma2 family endonuclease [Richelia sp. CSU_2_1]
MITIATPPEQRVLLSNISWQLYESLLAELGNQRSSRIAYHQNKLEIMVPLPEHENRNRQIDRLIVALIEELNLEYNPFGSMTIKKRQKSAGKEPDSCYYIQNEAKVRGKIELDFDRDPPPDLALEIDITSSSLNQFDLYADLGVPEIWRYDGRSIKFYRLQNGEYAECNFSIAFPILPTTKVNEFIDRCQNIGTTAAVRELREWAKHQSN